MHERQLDRDLLKIQRNLDIKFVIGEVSTTDGKRYLLLSCESGGTGDVEVLELDSDVNVLEALGYESSSGRLTRD